MNICSNIHIFQAIRSFSSDKMSHSLSVAEGASIRVIDDLINGSHPPQIVQSSPRFRHLISQSASNRNFSQTQTVLQHGIRNLSLISLWTVSLPGQLVSLLTGPFCLLCFSVKFIYSTLFGALVSRGAFKVSFVSLAGVSWVSQGLL